MLFEIVKFKQKNIRIVCPEHGPQPVVNCYDEYTKKDTAVVCKLCSEDKNSPKELG